MSAGSRNLYSDILWKVLFEHCLNHLSVGDSPVPKIHKKHGISEMVLRREEVIFRCIDKSNLPEIGTGMRSINFLPTSLIFLNTHSAVGFKFSASHFLFVTFSLIYNLILVSTLSIMSLWVICTPASPFFSFCHAVLSSLCLSSVYLIDLIL